MNPTTQRAEFKSLGESSYLAAPRFKTPWNAKSFPKKYSLTLRPSLTVPDQTFTIVQMIDRHRRGLPMEGLRTPVYQGGYETDLPSLDDIRRMDISERHDLILETKMKIEEYENIIKAQQTKRRDLTEEQKTILAQKELEATRNLQTPGDTSKTD